MSSFIWLEEYNTGDEEIDRQHQYLFVLANQIIASNNTQTTIKQINVLFRYLDEHFKSEEALMKHYNFPSYENHVNDHERLLKQLMNIADSVHTGKWNPNDIVIFMRDWLLVHVLEVDMLLC